MGAIVHVIDFEPHCKNVNTKLLTPRVYSPTANLIYCRMFNIHIFSFSAFFHQIVKASEAKHNILGFTNVI